MNDEFEIVHFSGHGTGNGLAFEDSFGRMYIPPRDALSDLLAEFSPPLKCVVLNACFSTSQGEFTSLGIPYTIAMEGPISDNTAIKFTEGFYDSIGAGKEIEFSFRQGVHTLRLSGYSESMIPKLLRKGEFISFKEEEAALPKRQPGFANKESFPLLVGIGIDVSGSMESNINNRVGTKQTRLEGFSEALEQGLNRCKNFLESVQNTQIPVKLFAYAFGLRTGDVCDLFSLIKVSSGIISDEEIEELKERFTEEIRRRYSGMGGLADLARNFGFGGAVDAVERGALANAEVEVRNRILAEVQRRLSSKLKTVGELTLGLAELSELWKNSTSSMADAEGLIFGNTPMCEALRRNKIRFQSEIKNFTDKNLVPILVLVSDGEPTDGDPKSIAKEIRGLGVTIICCYITDRNIVSPRTLYAEPEESWPNEAKLMFEMSSIISENSPLTRYLLREGWTITKDAKAFIQANHSEILEELVGLALSPLEAGYELLPKGR